MSKTDGNFITRRTAKRLIEENANLLKYRDALQRQVEAMREALSHLYALVAEGWLVRNTANDAHMPSFLAESARLVNTLKEVDAALAAQPAEGSWRR